MFSFVKYLTGALYTLVFSFTPPHSKPLEVRMGIFHDPHHCEAMGQDLSSEVANYYHTTVRWRCDISFPA